MDKIIKALIYNNEVSVSILNTTMLVNEAIKTHSLSPLAAAALGRTLTAVAYMSTELKNKKGSLSVAIKGDGVGGHITASGNSALQIRGVIDNPAAELPINKFGKLDVGGCVGNGSLTVVKDMGLKTPFTGTVDLISGEIAEDLAYYFLKSEQSPTAVALGVTIEKDGSCKGAGGIIIKPLPSCSEESLEECERVAKRLSNISELVAKNSPEKLLFYLFGDYEFQSYFPKYECTCNDDYIEKILFTLGKKELYDILEKEKKVNLHCHYCNKNYTYDKARIDEILEKK